MSLRKASERTYHWVGERFRNFMIKPISNRNCPIGKILSRLVHREATQAPNLRDQDQELGLPLVERSSYDTDRDTRIHMGYTCKKNIGKSIEVTCWLNRTILDLLAEV